MDLLVYRFGRKCRFIVTKLERRVSAVAEGGNLVFERNEVVDISVCDISNR